MKAKNVDVNAAVSFDLREHLNPKSPLLMASWGLSSGPSCSEIAAAAFKNFQLKKLILR